MGDIKVGLECLLEVCIVCDMSLQRRLKDNCPVLKLLKSSVEGAESLLSVSGAAKMAAGQTYRVYRLVILMDRQC
jgi:hypothetical protein